MRNTLFVFLMVLVSVAWVAAQQQGAPGSMGEHQNPNPGGRATGPASPDSNAPATTADPSKAAGAADSSQITEGCLGGAAPDFTVTDKAGTTYKLDIPKNADTAPLSAHVGQPVKVKGSITGKTIQVEQMARGAGNCPAGSPSQPSSK